MRLTIVQVAQPTRSDFLERAMEGLYRVLSLYGWIDLVFVLNGFSSKNEKIAYSLQSKFPDRIQVIKSVENLSMPHQILDLLKELSLDWVQFPGDDDLVIPENYKELLSDLDDETVAAIAFSAECIDAKGDPTGKILHPSFPNSNEAENFISAIAVPPFVFPSLVFRLSALGTEIFSSSLVFDWWLSLTLMRNGKIQIKSSKLVKYRIHPNQVSNSVKESRKRFEASLMIRHFFLNNSSWIASQLGNSSDELPELLSKHPPIFGDNNLGSKVVFDLRALLGARFSLTPAIRESFSQEIAFSDGILLDECEMPYVRTIALDNSLHQLNLGFSILAGTCFEMRERLKAIRNSRLADSCHFGCKHSKETSQRNVIILDCSFSFDPNQKSLWIEYLMKNVYLSSVGLRSRFSEMTASEAMVLRKFQSIVRLLRVLRKLMRNSLIALGAKK